MIADTTVSEITPAPAHRGIPWRIVAFVVTFQVLILLGGILVFTSLGFGGEATGSCGGG